MNPIFRSARNLANALLAATFAISTATTAQPTPPSLIGDTVSCSIAPPPAGPPGWTCTKPTAIVGAGQDFEIEYSIDPAHFGFDVNIGPFSIRIFANADNAFGVGSLLVTLSDLDFSPPAGIIGIANFVASGVGGSFFPPINPSNVSFTSNSVTINLGDGLWDIDAFVSFDLVVARPPLAASSFIVDSGVDFAGFDSSLQLDGDNLVVSYQADLNLKVATCTAGCGTASAIWVVSTVDPIGFFSFGTSLQLNGGNPVVAYHNGVDPTPTSQGGGSLKLATCTADCATATPTWVVTTVDQSSANAGLYPSLQVQGGNPIISYRDGANGDLKLATCTAGCATAAPTWIITTIDSVGNVGGFSDLQFNNGKPVVSYNDATNSMVKLATCTADCATVTPTWVIVNVASSTAAGEGRFSMQLNGGNPVISYPNTSDNALKVATCTAGCATATPTWIITTVDEGGEFQGVGAWSSIQLNGGNPVVSYSAPGFLKLAECTAGCATAAPSWLITTLDSEESWMPSLQLKGNQAFVTYFDFDDSDLKLAVVRLAAVPARVVEFQHAGLDHYFVTADPVEAAAIDNGSAGPGWTRTNLSFGSGGTARVCRFFGNVAVNPATGAPFGPNSHFYTATPSECAVLTATFTPTAKSWHFESYDFVTTPPVGGLGDAATCPAGTVPVYRAYNRGFERGEDSNHRFTNDFAAYQGTVARGWAGEGIHMCAPADVSIALEAR